MWLRSPAVFLFLVKKSCWSEVGASAKRKKEKERERDKKRERERERDKKRHQSQHPHWGAPSGGTLRAAGLLHSLGAQSWRAIQTDARCRILEGGGGRTGAMVNTRVGDPSRGNSDAWLLARGVLGRSSPAGAALTAAGVGGEPAAPHLLRESATHFSYASGPLMGW